MSYSEKAKERRRCKGTRKDGEPCRAWAMWGNPEQLCVSCAGRHHRGPQANSEAWKAYIRSGRPGWEAPRVDTYRRAKCEPCACPAYPFPHRPGSGRCCWPDDPPVVELLRRLERLATDELDPT